MNEQKQKQRLIFVIGYLGAPVRKRAKDLARQEGLDYLDLDRIIEEKDGRSIARICKMGGEHAYRNLEYEEVKALVDHGNASPSGEDSAAGIVVACGDGILYDDMTRDLILAQELILIGRDLSPEELWESAREDAASWHAFLRFGTEQERKQSFMEYLQRQKRLFDSIPAGMSLPKNRKDEK